MTWNRTIYLLGQFLSAEKTLGIYGA